MPRPRLCRKVVGTPRSTYFKPKGVPLAELGERFLTVEGLEALRLSDLECLTTSEAAVRMGVSRHTFGRVLAEARRAVADALVNALALRIEGGEYEVTDGEASPDQPIPWQVSPDVVAVSAQGPSLEDGVDARFGRAAGFVVVELSTMATRFVDNASSQARAHGAGVRSVERIAEAGAGVVLTGVIGDKAFKALEKAGVRACVDLGDVSVLEALERYKSGRIPFADGPNK